MSNPEVVQVALSKIVAATNNPRRHSEAQVLALADSISEVGVLNPLILSASNEIIAGHGRFAAASLLGMERVPCLYASHLSHEEQRAYRIADNRLGEGSEWDAGLLNDELSALMDLGMDASKAGFPSLEEMVAENPAGGGSSGSTAPSKKLEDSFGVSPFSVVLTDTKRWRERQGEWLTPTSDPEEDPVLFEVILHWFCPPGGAVAASGLPEPVIEGLDAQGYEFAIDPGSCGMGCALIPESPEEDESLMSWFSDCLVDSAFAAVVLRPGHGAGSSAVLSLKEQAKAEGFVYYNEIVYTFEKVSAGDGSGLVPIHHGVILIFAKGNARVAASRCKGASTPEAAAAGDHSDLGEVM